MLAFNTFIMEADVHDCIVIKGECKFAFSGLVFVVQQVLEFIWTSIFDLGWNKKQVLVFRLCYTWIDRKNDLLLV